MFDTWASQATIVLLNRMLAREAWARDQLLPFAGRVARLALPPLAVTFAVTPQGMLVRAEAGQAADVTLVADTAALPLMLVDRKALMRNLKLQGDVEFAQTLGQVLQNLKPEPEEELAPWVGDAAAVRLVGLARAAFEYALDTGKRMSHSAADYLTAENPILAAPSDVDAFVQDVHALRDDTERLEARIDQLAQLKS